MSCRRIGHSLLGGIVLVMVAAASALAGSLVPDADCPGLVCQLSDSALDVTINVSWQPDTNNLGFVDVFTEWRASESDPDGAIEGVPIGSHPTSSDAFTVFLTGFDPSVPRMASIFISYSSQLRPQDDPQGINCGTSGLCTDFFGAVTYTIAIDAFELPRVRLGTQDVGDGVALQIDDNRKDDGGRGTLIGGRVHSPSGDPDLFFRAGATPTFPGPLEELVEWSTGGFEVPPGECGQQACSRAPWTGPTTG